MHSNSYNHQGSSSTTPPPTPTRLQIHSSWILPEVNKKVEKLEKQNHELRELMKERDDEVTKLKAELKLLRAENEELKLAASMMDGIEEEERMKTPTSNGINQMEPIDEEEEEGEEEDEAMEDTEEDDEEECADGNGDDDENDEGDNGEKEEVEEDKKDMEVIEEPIGLWKFLSWVPFSSFWPWSKTPAKPSRKRKRLDSTPESEKDVERESSSTPRSVMESPDEPVDQNAIKPVIFKTPRSPRFVTFQEVSDCRIQMSGRSSSLPPRPSSCPISPKRRRERGDPERTIKDRTPTPRQFFPNPPTPEIRFRPFGDEEEEQEEQRAVLPRAAPKKKSAAFWTGYT